MFLGRRSLYVGSITNRVSFQPLAGQACQISQTPTLQLAEATNNGAPPNAPIYQNHARHTGKTLPARLSFTTFLHYRPTEHLGQPRGDGFDSRTSFDTRPLGGTAVRKVKSALGHHFDNEADRITALLSVIAHPKQVIIRGSNTVDMIILSILEHYGGAAIPQPLLEAVISPVSQSLRFPGGQETFNRICPSLLHHIEHLPKPQPTRQPSNFVRSIFRLLQTLAPSLPEQSFKIYRLLADKQYIPIAFLQDKDLAEGTLRNFFYVSCIRACCHWKWTNLASTFLQDLIDDGGLPIPIMPQLIQDVLDLRLESPTREDILASIQLIIRAHSVKPVTNDTISKVYASAAQMDMVNETKALHAFTRQSQVVKEHNYPPLPGSTILWFTTHLANQENKRLLKDLFEEVRSKRVVIPPLDRAPLIELIVRNSYGQLAQAFWVKYSRGRYGSFVKNNAGLMLNMVRFFSAAAAQRQQEALNNTEGGGNNDPKAFAKHVLDVFREANEPLVSAPFSNLTSIAKAFSHLGEIDESLLTCIERKRRVGRIDMVDQNVFFKYLAQRNPSRALWELEKLTKSGARVGFGSFTSIMHSAMQLDRFELVKQTALRFNELQCNSPHPSWAIFGPIEPLARAADRDKPGPPAQVRRRFQTILDVMSIMQYPPQAYILNLETGKLLINSSLPHCADLAFEFWKLFMKDLVRWEDQDHCSIRRIIGEGIISSRGLGRKRRKEILSELHG